MINCVCVSSPTQHPLFNLSLKRGERDRARERGEREGERERGRERERESEKEGYSHYVLLFV